MEVWKVEGLDCLALYSLRDIKANESVTFDHSAQVKVIEYKVLGRLTWFNNLMSKL